MVLDSISKKLDNMFGSQKSELPGAIILGAQKAGTSSLFVYLSAHPEIVAPKTKEINFFTQEKNWSRGSTWYKSHFEFKVLPGKPRVPIEATPEYLYYPFVAGRIKQTVPKAKFIVMLREPVSRAYSAWNMYKKLYNSDVRQQLINLAESENSDTYVGLSWLMGKREYPTFQEAIDYELQTMSSTPKVLEPSFIRRGFYAEQIENYYQHFGHEQFFFCTDAELKENRTGVLNRITNFLDLSEFDFASKLGVPKNVGMYTSQIDPETEAKLQDSFKPQVEKLKSLLNQEINW